MDLDLTCSINCVISKILKIPEVAGVNPVEAAKVPTFQKNNSKFYIFVVTLSINNRIEFLEKIKQRFKRIFSWN